MKHSLASLEALIRQYKAAQTEADAKWAQIQAILPGATKDEVLQPKTKAKAKKPTTKYRQGRRDLVASGDIPPLRERMAIVMGNQVMSGPEILGCLRARVNWAPVTDNPLNYLSMMLSLNPEFVRVSRGRYRVKGQREPSPMARFILWAIQNGAKKPETTQCPAEHREGQQAFRKMSKTHRAQALARYKRRLV